MRMEKVRDTMYNIVSQEASFWVIFFTKKVNRPQKIAVDRKVHFDQRVFSPLLSTRTFHLNASEVHSNLTCQNTSDTKILSIPFTLGTHMHLSV